MDEFEQMEQHEIPEDHPLEESPGETLDRKLRACFDGKSSVRTLPSRSKRARMYPFTFWNSCLGNIAARTIQM